MHEVWEEDLGMARSVVAAAVTAFAITSPLPLLLPSEVPLRRVFASSVAAEPPQAPLESLFFLVLKRRAKKLPAARAGLFAEERMDYKSSSRQGKRDGSKLADNLSLFIAF